MRNGLFLYLRSFSIFSEIVLLLTSPLFSCRPSTTSRLAAWRRSAPVWRMTQTQVIPSRTLFLTSASSSTVRKQLRCFERSRFAAAQSVLGPGSILAPDFKTCGDQFQVSALEPWTWRGRTGSARMRTACTCTATLTASEYRRADS